MLLSVTPEPLASPSPHDGAGTDGSSPFAALLLGSPDRRSVGGTLGKADSGGGGGGGGGGGRSIALLEELIDVVRG